MNTRMSEILTKLDNNNKEGIASFVNEELDTYPSALAQHFHIILGMSVILLFWRAFIS